MGRQLLAFAVALALIITTRPITVTGQQRNMPPNAVRPNTTNGSQRSEETGAAKNDQPKTQDTYASAKSSAVEAPATAPQTDTPNPKTRNQWKLWKDRFRRAFAPAYWSEWTLAAFGIVGIVVGIFTLVSLRQESDAARRSADVAALSLALTNRGFVHIGGWGPPSMTETQSNFPYSLSCRGRTPIKIERGEMRLSFAINQAGLENHSLIDTNTPPEEWVKLIPPQIVGPFMKTPEYARPILTFPPLSKDGLDLWNRGTNITVFLTGHIWYRDAFPNTRLHHKYFGVRGFRGSLELGGWYVNPAVRNDEEDEDERQ